MAITGVVLSCVKAAAARRLDLRVVVCLNHYSTLCKGVVHGFFSGSGMDGKELWFRTYSGLIDQHYLPEPVTDYLGAAVDAVCRIHTTEPPGDLLVFLPGCTDVEAAEHALNGLCAAGASYMLLTRRPPDAPDPRRVPAGGRRQAEGSASHRRRRLLGVRRWNQVHRRLRLLRNGQRPRTSDRRRRLGGGAPGSRPESGRP
ncbi:Os11g0196100 [Oryza sativa Japonica Group]|uniref:Os11g0196100 protein n=1 Tax=Oryza sativa subsp. japonica TaxID=39947 RepID=A0A0P0XZM9_ORYSJ|nr:Os11g0196100 [Oryza sativa Japonica Group]